MIPVGALVAAYLATRSNGPGKSQNALKLCAVPLGAIGVMTLLVGHHPAWALLVGALAGGLACPHVVLHLVVVPLGLPRVAYAFARVTSPAGYTSERHGSPAYFAALAAVRARRVDLRVLDWIEARLDREKNVRAVSLTAAALVVAARGKRRSARLLFEAVSGLGWRVAPHGVRGVARAWLVADAAERADWSRAARLGSRGWHRWPRAVAALARRIAREPDAPSNVALWGLWALAPHRRRTYALLRRALATPRATSPSEAVETREALPGSDPLDAALRAHAAALAAPSAHALERASRAWAIVRDASSVAAHLARRALAVGARTPPGSVLADALAVAAEDLAPQASEEYAAPRADQAGSTDLLAARAETRDLEELELAVNLLAARASGAASLHVLNEWMQWSSVRRTCERLCRRGDEETRRTVFALVFVSSCNYAAWLFNRRSEKLLANTVFRWLLELGDGVADPEARALLRQNVKVGHGA